MPAGTGHGHGHGRAPPTCNQPNPKACRVDKREVAGSRPAGGNLKRVSLVHRTWVWRPLVTTSTLRALPGSTGGMGNDFGERAGGVRRERVASNNNHMHVQSICFVVGLAVPEGMGSAKRTCRMANIRSWPLRPHQGWPWKRGWAPQGE